jgi:hypothetical protein
MRGSVWLRVRNSRLCGFCGSKRGLRNGAALAFGLMLIGAISGCGGRSIAGGEMEKIASAKYEGFYDAVAVDGDGGVLVAWSDNHGSYGPRGLALQAVSRS